MLTAAGADRYSMFRKVVVSSESFAGRAAAVLAYERRNSLSCMRSDSCFAPSLRTLSAQPVSFVPHGSSFEFAWRAKPVSDDAAHDVQRTSFGLFVDSPHIFADHSKEKQEHAREKRDQQEQRRETLGGLTENDLCKQSIKPE